MSERDSKITLTNDNNESINRWENDLSIPGDFKAATAVFGGWIIFNMHQKEVKDYLILDPENKPKGKLDGGNPITAVTTVSYLKNGICLCESKSFFGKNYTYGSDSSTEEQFPIGQQGQDVVSSFIIFGDAKWKLYYEDAPGVYKHKEVSGECDDLAKLGIAGDKIFKVVKI